jgi:hypothetical protein
MLMANFCVPGGAGCELKLLLLVDTGNGGDGDDGRGGFLGGANGGSGGGLNASETGCQELPESGCDTRLFS